MSIEKRTIEMMEHFRRPQQRMRFEAHMSNVATKFFRDTYNLYDTLQVHVVEDITNRVEINRGVKTVVLDLEFISNHIANNERRMIFKEINRLIIKHMEEN